MIGYPNAKKTQNSVQPEKKILNTSNRGMTLENDLNLTNQYYLDCDRAVIHKKPTPIQVVKVDYPKRSAAKIVEAYYRTPSTTDYNGVYRGKAIDFEAKEIHSKTALPFQVIHEHQITHLKRVIRHGAIAFLIVRFCAYDQTFLVDAKKVIDAYEHRTRQSLPYQWFLEEAHLIPYGLAPRVDYLRVVDEQYL